MSERDADEFHVLLCDWQGRLSWSSKSALYEAYGDLAWDYVVEQDRDRYRRAFSQTMTLRTQQQLDVDCVQGGRYRAWLWPLNWPDAAVCVLAQRIPEAMSLLTPREQECLGRLAQGHPVEKIADQLDVSTSTVHTLMRRARKKLNLDRIEELISFSARHCYPMTGPFKPPVSNLLSGK